MNDFIKNCYPMHSHSLHSTHMVCESCLYTLLTVSINIYSMAGLAESEIESVSSFGQLQRGQSIQNRQENKNAKDKLRPRFVGETGVFSLRF